MHLTLEMVTEEWKLVTSDVFHDLYQSKRNKRRMTWSSYSWDDIMYVHRYREM